MAFLLALAVAPGAAMADPAGQPLPPIMKFVATPDQMKAVSDLLAKQWTELFASCPSLSRKADRVSVVSPLTFDDAGRPTHGAWSEQIDMSGCGASRALNVLSLVASDGGLKHALLLPGLTMADPVLQRDSLQYVRSAMLTLVSKDCQQVRIVDTRFLGFADTPAPDAASGREKRPWNEEWTVRACDTAALVTIHYIPNARGTAISTSPQETRKIEAK